MTKCKFCSSEIQWDRDFEGNYFPLNSDGSRHNCKTVNQSKSSLKPASASTPQSMTHSTGVPPVTPQAAAAHSLIPIRIGVTLGKTLPTGSYSSARGEFHIEAEIPERVGFDQAKLQLAIGDLKKVVLVALTKWEEENKALKT